MAPLQPTIDTCGIKTNGNYDCPAELSEINPATIMSYCNLCTDGGKFFISVCAIIIYGVSFLTIHYPIVQNIAMTLGGSWGQDDRSDVNNWINNPTIGSFNDNATRIPKMMWDLISNRGTCMVPATPPPDVTCSTVNDW